MMTLSEYLNLEEETIQGIQRAIEAEAVREWEILGKELACERKVFKGVKLALSGGLMQIKEDKCQVT